MCKLTEYGFAFRLKAFDNFYWFVFWFYLCKDLKLFSVMSLFHFLTVNKPGMHCCRWLTISGRKWKYHALSFIYKHACCKRSVLSYLQLYSQKIRVRFQLNFRLHNFLFWNLYFSVLFLDHATWMGKLWNLETDFNIQISPNKSTC